MDYHGLRRLQFSAWKSPFSTETSRFQPHLVHLFVALARNMWPRKLYSRAVCIGEEQYLEVIRLQEPVQAQKLSVSLPK